MIVEQGGIGTHAALEKRLDGLSESEELQDRGLRVVDDDAQFAQAVFDICLNAVELAATQRFFADQSFEIARDPGQIGECLVVQILSLIHI